MAMGSKGNMTKHGPRIEVDRGNPCRFHHEAQDTIFYSLRFIQHSITSSFGGDGLSYDRHTGIRSGLQSHHSRISRHLPNQCGPFMARSTRLLRDSIPQPLPQESQCCSTHATPMFAFQRGQPGTVTEKRTPHPARCHGLSTASLEAAPSEASTTCPAGDSSSVPVGS